MKKVKKYLLSLAAVLTLSMAAPQSANAQVHRVFQPIDQDFYMQAVYDDQTGVYAHGKWIITFGISYSAHDATGLRIALALYRSAATRRRRRWARRRPC